MSTAQITQQAAKAITASVTSPLILELAERWKMSPATMIKTIKATVFPQVDKQKQPLIVTDEQLMMFLQVAHQYDLNPFLKEILAFLNKQGGVVPMVPIDGWAKIINRHPEMDGIEFTDRMDNGKIVAITCVIYRKDRRHPTSITEYMAECRVSGDYTPWNTHPARMLRHKALIQCGRVAFSLAGIYDPDEAARIIEAEDQREPVTRPKALEAAPERTLAAQPIDAVPQHIQTTTNGPGAVPDALRAEVQGVAGIFPDEPKTDTREFADAACTCEWKDGDNPQCAVHGETAPIKTQPAGPYVDKFNKVFVIAAGAGIKVVKGSHDDELHKILAERWGITSVKMIPVSIWDHVCEELGKALAVKQ